MSPRSKREPAVRGSLAPSVIADLQTLLEFFAARERLWAETFGRSIPPSPLRDLIVRNVVLDFALDRSRRMTEYVGLLRGIVVENTIRKEVYRLEDAGLLVSLVDEKDRRARVIVPSRQLVEYYNRWLPPLAVAVTELIEARPK